MQSLIYGIGFGLLGISSWGMTQSGFGPWMGLFLLLGLLPVLEALFHRWSLKPFPLSRGISDAWLFLSPFLLTASLLHSGYQFLEKSSGLEKLGIILSCGAMMGALGITIAHELVHRPQAWQRALGVWNLLLVNFAHWGVEHVFGHHKNVATPEDPATALKNQSLYRFWAQDYFGGLKHSWLFERQRLNNRGQGLVGNRILHYFLFTAFVSFGLFLFDVEALFFWWSQSFVAILLLLSVDYIEHYGLERQKKENGLYEPVKPEHSWDTSAFLTNSILFHLGLHSHHHMKARLPYYELQENPQAYQMPFGYSTMILVAFVPPLYFKLMNPRLETPRGQYGKKSD